MKNFLLILIVGASHVWGYCWQAGQNPGWAGPPKVSQRSMDTVRVNWAGMVTKRECTDNFVVKYWPISSPANYHITELVDPSINFVDIKITPKIDYNYQVNLIFQGKKISIIQLKICSGCC